ncbi:MAG TPA: hypothetical protein VIF62_11985, partial [Labilithrix sp.]
MRRGERCVLAAALAIGVAVAIVACTSGSGPGSPPPVADAATLADAAGEAASPPSPVDAGVDADASTIKCTSVDAGPAGAVCVADGGICWEVPTPTGYDVTALWASGPSDFWAAAGDRLLHGDGVTWRESYATSGVRISTMWGSGPDDVWAGGSTTGTAPLLHWDGCAWTPTTIPIPTPIVTSIWGSGADDVWFGGDALVHWDGATWTPAAGVVGANSSALAIFGLGPKDVWAIIGTSGSSRMEHWDGTSWTMVGGLDAIPSDFGSAFWGTSDTDLWLGTGDYPLLDHWDGARWTIVTLSNPIPELFDAWGASSSTTHAFWGTGPNDINVLMEGFTLHYDGANWKLVTKQGGIATAEAGGVRWSGTRAGVLRTWNGSGWNTTTLETFSNDMQAAAA